MFAGTGSSCLSSATPAKLLLTPAAALAALPTAAWPLATLPGRRPLLQPAVAWRVCWIWRRARRLRGLPAAACAVAAVGSTLARHWAVQLATACSA